MIHFIGLSWLIWQRRNKLLFQHKAQEIHIWVRWAHEQLDEFFGEVQSSRQDMTAKVKQKWHPPPPDYVIINTDASIIQDKMGSGLSILFVNLAEAAAIRLGVLLAHRLSVPKAIVSTDCLGVVNGLKSVSPPFSDWGMLGREILPLQQHFLSLKFTYVPRDCNAKREFHKIPNALCNRTPKDCMSIRLSSEPTQLARGTGCDISSKQTISHW
ncbi:hypothetical protein G4B88_024300 [Cannabis sativa]|uniref:RNase H type-1 domain-containing protein n=1 Tax=Cannabis sativa TaxID=3483 RepID=A0A7J6GGB7_CANSA|nr:hypothetical protein G4B88_024300 [Cannabis sativa]